MNIDPQHIESLWTEKKYDEVRKIIAEASATPLSNKEKGAAFVGLASIYLDLVNTIKNNYCNALQKAVNGMKKIADIERQGEKKLKLKAVKADLGL